MESNRAVIINGAVGAWYPQGQSRLNRSLIYHGWNGDILLFNEEIQSLYFENKSPYTIKSAAFDSAIQQNYQYIIWMDCSLWVVDDPNKMLNILKEKGGLFIKSGYNLAQTSGDQDLNWAGFTRNHAEKLPELWSCIFGVNMATEQGKNFAKWFLEASLYGVFNTPREHSGLSKDPRFLHARQDQTAASWAYHKSGYDCLMEPGEILSYYNANQDTLIKMRGM